LDDQSPQLANAYSGNWSHIQGGAAANFTNSTLSFTETPGSTFKFSFDGTQALIYGAVLNGSTYPQATYMIDDSSAGSGSPYVDSSGQVIYFITPELSSTTHTIFVNVTMASPTSPFILDSVLFVPASSMDTSGMVMTQTAIPSNTAAVSASKSNAGAIAGGVVGGVAALAALVFGLFFCMRWRRSKPYYFEQPGAGDILANEVSPFPHPSPPPNMQQNPQQQFFAPSPYGAPSAHGVSGVDSSDARDTSHAPLLNNMSPLHSPHSVDFGAVSSSSGGQRTGKVGSQVQTRAPTEHEAFQHADSGVRFGDRGRPSTVSIEVPPSYSAS